MATINKRMELLFLYDVKDNNPNGDPMDENKPRIDEETRINIVTDVRLKRTIRDYFFNYKGYNGENEKDILCRQTEAEGGGIKDGKHRALDFGKKEEDIESNILSKCIDVRLFGAVVPLDKSSVTYTGPVQFKMGRSLHKVELQHIKGTGAFAAKNGAHQQTFREEYILPYSLICFYGVVNENTAQYTNLSDNDIDELIEAMWNGTKNLLTRSKIGHTPQLLIKVIYKEKNFFIGDLDKLISLDTQLQDEKIRDISEVKIDCSNFSNKIKQYKDKIEKIEIIKGDRCEIINLENEGIKELIEYKTI